MSEPMTNFEYTLRLGQVCPACHKGHAFWTREPPRNDLETGKVYIEAGCEDCLARWIEVYGLIGYSDLETENDT